MRKRHPANASGEWFVDTACTDCGAARVVAPGLIVEKDGQSVFARQPKTRDELIAAWRARLLCPTASVRTEHKIAQPGEIFPQLLTDDVYRLGYNASSSYGAHSFLIRRRAGNVMVDSPRFARALVTKIEEWGGLSRILLTHQDDIADADRYAAKFKASVTIHKSDRRRVPYATDILDGTEPIALAADLLAIPVPGHTKGSVAYLYDRRSLFAGDSLAWDFETEELTAHRDYCWYSWDEQTRSLARLLNYPFEWVLAGHGGSHGLAAAEMRAQLERLLVRMKRA